MAKKEESTVTVAEENALSRYIRETRGELRKVTWPTREEAWRLTAIVIGVTAAFAVFLWAVDALFANSLRLLINAVLGL
ncbi:Protein translocase subunit SecE [Candidatus Promineifilum breve]|uniref:Protein translocase subunit SecE n=1 Tax=Candidatus Promineifilum breve TaxID=1806508 RepID=A0A160T893_9CHLR|nr:preprotein translocase subunit SecE [Candidatus Promineifilum breve]CUS06252.1 Protein translocase subunit SecE [Candidatus Promineifilum breve]